MNKEEIIKLLYELWKEYLGTDRPQNLHSFMEWLEVKEQSLKEKLKTKVLK